MAMMAMMIVVLGLVFVMMVMMMTRRGRMVRMPAVRMVRVVRMWADVKTDDGDESVWVTARDDVLLADHCWPWRQRSVDGCRSNRRLLIDSGAAGDFAGVFEAGGRATERVQCARKPRAEGRVRPSTTSRESSS
eukprot:1991642-Rhodomonas_salina.2